MDKNIKKSANKKRRHGRTRAKISGTIGTPRLSVFRSNMHMYAQLIDDQSGKTMASVHTKEIKDKGADKTAKALEAGKLIARKAKEKNISSIKFDRGGNKYHGRVKALADGAREEGLIF